MILNTRVCIMKGCKPRLIMWMYEHERGIPKHKHKLELDKKEKYFPLLNILNSRNTQGYTKLLKLTQLKSTQG